MALDDHTSVEAQLSVLNALWSAHTEQDKNQFDKLSAQLETLDDKIDALLVREASREGEIKGQRRMMIAISAIISLIVSMAGVAVAMNVGG